MTQAVLGSIAAVMVVMLLLIRFLDSPSGRSRRRPTVAMERTLDIIDQALRSQGVGEPPCDAKGNSVG